MKKKVILLVCICLFLCTGCGKVPKLSNGDDVFVSVNGKNLSANDMYNELKEKYGVDVLIELVDKIILEEKYEENDDLKEYVDAQIEQYISSYGEEGFAQALEQSNMTEDDLRQTIALDYRRNQAALDYAKKQVSDDELNDYYENDYRGDIKASHILITPDENAEDSEKADEEALNQAKDIIKQLDEGADFAELAKEYSDDGSASEGGDLGYFGKGTMVDEFEDAVVELEVGEYTKEPVKSTYGYHIILKVDEKEKPKLEDVKDELIEELANQKLNENSTLKYEALVQLRKDAGLEIQDDGIKEKYNSYMDSLITPLQ